MPIGPLGLAAGMLTLVSSLGCGTHRFAATSNELLLPDEPLLHRILTPDEQSQVLEAMQSFAAGRSEADPPSPAASGVRWSDVPLAADYACDANSMAVVSIAKGEGIYTFQLKSIEDYPGVLTVRRVDDERICTAEASIGRYGDYDTKAVALLASFDEFLRGFGAKRGFEDEAPPPTPPPSPAPAKPPPTGPHHP
jgi:hypothetical protein